MIAFYIILGCLLSTLAFWIPKILDSGFSLKKWQAWEAQQKISRREHWERYRDMFAVAYSDPQMEVYVEYGIEPGTLPTEACREILTSSESTGPKP